MQPKFIALGALAALVLCAAARTGEKSVDYGFQNAPVNAMGVTSMSDLRGKPVLIDFWGIN